MNASTPKTKLGIFDTAALVAGCAIGAGIFRLSDSVAQHSLTPGLFLFAWVVGGVLSLCAALSYGELAARFPKNGGDYVFVTEAYGPMWGFVFGWTKLLINNTGTLAILGFVFAEHCVVALGIPAGWVKPLASVAIVALTAANIRGLNLGRIIQNSLTVSKLLALLLIVLLGLWVSKGSTANFTPVLPDAEPLSVLSSFGLAMIFVLWAYGGWEEVAGVAEEMENPQKTFPRAVALGLLTVTLLYLLINSIYLYYLPLPVMQNTDLVAAGTMEHIAPGFGIRIVAFMVMASTLGALNGFILTGGRFVTAVGRDHRLFRKLGEVSEKRGTPAFALIFTSLVALILIWTKTLNSIVQYTAAVTYLFFVGIGVSLILFRRRYPRSPTTFRVPGYPVVPVIFIALYASLAANAWMMKPIEAAYGLGIAASGLLFHVVSAWGAAKPTQQQ
jgi:amino acid transporter